MSLCSAHPLSLRIVNYLLRPSDSASGLHPRTHLAVAILIVYSILLLLVGTTYFRLLYTVITDPGYVERGPQWYEEKQRLAQRKDTRSGAARLRGHDLRRARRRGTERSKTRYPGHEPKDSHLGDFGYRAQAPTSGPTATDEVSRDLQNHYTKDVFVCEGDGRPIWCSSCMNWKPDRAHHCREIDRCVRKMDHFCPW